MYIFLPEILILIGASEELIPYCLTFRRTIFLFLPCMLTEVCAYVNEIFFSIVFAICTATVTIVGFKFGAKDFAEIKSLRNKNIFLTLILEIILTATAIFFVREISMIFVGYDKQIYELTIQVLKIFSLTFLFYGFNLFTAFFFTGLEKSFLSTAIVFLQSLKLPSLFIFILPEIFGTDAIWFALPAATYFILEKGVNYGAVPIGRPVPNCSAFVLDKFGNLLPQGAVGELCLSGLQIVAGYWKLPEKTAEVFQTIIFPNGEERKIYRTGYLARYNEDGQLEYIGRVDFQIKLRGLYGSFRFYAVGRNAFDS